MRTSLNNLRARQDAGLLGVVCNNTSVAILITDETQACVYANPSAEELLGYRVDELVGQHLHEVLHHSHPDGRPYPIEDCPLNVGLPPQDRLRGREMFIHRDGRFIPVEYTASPIRDGEDVVGTVLEARDISEELEWRGALEDEARTLETLNRTGSMFAGKLDVEGIVQAVTDAATKLSGAEFGSFFYNTVAPDGKLLQLYTLSGASREAFAHFPQPRHTGVFGPTFGSGEVVRSDDIRTDPRYGQMGPFHGLPPGHLPVRSYLGAPVLSRDGHIFGALIFGHSQPGVFTERSERFVTALAFQAAIAIENARLYEAAQQEIVERQTAEDHQKLLVQELNHRVKNMLATVQSIATRTFRGQASEASRRTFEGRLHALSHSHSLLMRRSWRDVQLRDILVAALSPFVDDPGTAGSRARLDGEEVMLSPKMALALGLGFHELATNAVKHGALGEAAGNLEVRWQRRGNGDMTLTWTERGGPPVRAPGRRGFGSRLLERGLAHEVGGAVQLEFEPQGLVCEIIIPQREVDTQHDG